MAKPSDPAVDLDVVAERVLFAGEDGGFAVVRVVPEGGGEGFVAAGAFPWAPEVGEPVRLSGRFEAHPRFGRRFKVDAAKPRVPATAEGIRRYLGSGSIKGIGKTLAERLVDHFGAETLQVLEHAPERAAEIRGVGPARVEELRRRLLDQRDQREALVFLQGLGLGVGLAHRIWARFGRNAIGRVRASPYGLIGEVEGVGFQTADRVARGLGFSPTSAERLVAGLVAALGEAAEAGDLCLGPEDLVARASVLLAAETGLVRAALAEAAASGRLRALSGAGSASTGPRVYLPALEAAEAEAAARLLALADARRPPAPAFDPSSGADDEVAFTDEQRRAVELLLAVKVGLLTGGPGVGKTTVLRAVVRAYEAAGFRVALASPTGRAARRLAEATARDAQTLHRLLGLVPGVETRDLSKSLEAEVLVVDETSMLDLPLLVRVLRRVPPATIVIFVGDPDQLPSVGPGQVLRDLLECGRFDTARLRTIFRQGRQSLIVENAHRILQGEALLLPERGKLEDFFFVERRDPEEGAALVEHLFLERIPARFGLSARDDIQVLCPMHRGAVGTEALNRRLQMALNRDRKEIAFRDRVFREGDRVMCVRNDYDLAVMNGDLGTIVAIHDEQGVEASFDGRSVLVMATNLDLLVPAFAISVHKAQGGEFPAVILTLYPEHRLMLRRSVLYTAVTRARRVLVIVGTRWALERALADGSEPRRQGELADRLRGVPFRPVELPV